MRNYYTEVVLPAFTAIGICIALAIYSLGLALVLQ
jgi:hypothetical protein